MKKLMKKWMMGCDEATMAITQRQEGALSLRKRVRLRVHLLGCKFCSLFEKQSRILSNSAHNLQQNSEDLLVSRKLSDQKKAEMREALDAASGGSLADGEGGL